ncbi:MAG: cell division protein FtsB [Gammaproteobacteria bacterium]|nr:cell division protein FtsB [Gammaproteobacteria bacterium]
MRLLLLTLAGTLLGLQLTLWYGRGGAQDVWRIQEQIAAQRAENAQLETRNNGLAAEVIDLKQGLDAIEELARSEMGMVREGEIFIQLLDPLPVSATQRE